MTDAEMARFYAALCELLERRVEALIREAGEQ